MAVVDSSVLIPLLRIGKISLLEKFFDNIIINKDIYDEIKEGIGSTEVEEGLKNWIKLDKRDFDEAKTLSEKSGISLADASIILLAKENKDILISNDYGLIITAKSMGVECLWLTSLLIRCLKKKIIAKKEAKDILLELTTAGMRLGNIVYAAILDEIDKY